MSRCPCHLRCIAKVADGAEVQWILATVAILHKLQVANSMIGTCRNLKVLHFDSGAELYLGLSATGQFIGGLERLRCHADLSQRALLAPLSLSTRQLCGIDPYFQRIKPQYIEDSCLQHSDDHGYAGEDAIKGLLLAPCASFTIISGTRAWIDNHAVVFAGKEASD
jgi:hypothetical protein